jgi:PD-(D/E)XK nuclease superfamily protein
VDTQAAASLLDEFKKVPGRISRPQTFMEIGGYPHYENVCSNFLAFFFDPEGPHGLGSLFLKALAGSVGIEGVDRGLGGNVSVEREVFTEAANRIDILIRSDSYAVLIENKIFAAVANPFEDYAAYLRSLKNESREVYPDENKIKILLTLYPSGVGSEWGFVNVTHAEFAGAVRSSLGHHVSGADTRYLTLMLDFLNTLENLGEGTRMNQEFINLLAERSEEVATFLKGITDVRTEVKKKALALGERIGERIDLQDHEDVLLLPWQPNPNHDLVYLLQYRVSIDDDSYAVVQPSVSPSGWQIQTFHRVSPKSQHRLKLQESLGKNGIPPEAEAVVHPKRFGYDQEDLGSIAEVVEAELRRVIIIVQEISDKEPRSRS